MDIPPDFRWADHLGRPTLFYRHRRLADVQSHDGRWHVGIGLHRMDHAYKGFEFSTQAVAIAFINRWAVLREAKIRLEAI